MDKKTLGIDMDTRILKYGNPFLYRKSERVTNPKDEDIKSIVQTLKQTMEREGANGLSAPQIGIPFSIAVFKVPKTTHNPKYALTPEYDPEGVNLTTMINASYTPLGEQMVDEWEGCLSVPGMLGLVPRYLHIEYSFLDLSGKKITRKASGFHARIIQHELDHLEGILFPNRIKDTKYFGYTEEIVETTTFVNSRRKA